MSKIKDALMSCAPASAEYNEAMKEMHTWASVNNIKHIVFHEYMEIGHSPTMEELIVYFQQLSNSFGVSRS